MHWQFQTNPSGKILPSTLSSLTLIAQTSKLTACKQFQANPGQEEVNKTEDRSHTPINFEHFTPQFVFGMTWQSENIKVPICFFQISSPNQCQHQTLKQTQKMQSFNSISIQTNTQQTCIDNSISKSVTTTTIIILTSSDQSTAQNHPLQSN